jgi:hypothetical protein
MTLLDSLSLGWKDLFSKRMTHLDRNRIELSHQLLVGGGGALLWENGGRGDRKRVPKCQVVFLLLANCIANVLESVV